MNSETARQTALTPANRPQEAFQDLCRELETCIIGQDKLVEHLLIALLADGHLLVEGAPGLAKTTAIKELASRIEGDFHRLQFTPDLLPGDLTGTDIYRPQSGAFEFQHGPIFHNLILADEINRSPAKVQSALLEAMGEHQITVGQTTYSLPRLFLVMATQNPIEHEGTYPLPEAQLDRFLMHLRIDYPQATAEKRILELARRRAQSEASAPAPNRPLLTQEQISATVQARVAPSRWTVAHARAPGCRDATLSRRRTCSRWLSRPCATASCCPSKPRPRASIPTVSLTN
jgi:MoxR-like ATPase